MKENLNLKGKKGGVGLILLIIFGVILILVILALIYEIRFFNDPKNLALSQTDVPAVFTLSSNSSLTGYKGNSYWYDNTDKQYALSHGFKSGYHNTFFYTDPSTGTVTIITSTVSIYNSGNISTVYNDNKNLILNYENNTNSTPVGTPGSWKNSFGRYETYNSSIGEIKLYSVLFYKQNVLAGVTVSQNNASADLSGTAIYYAQIMRNKITPLRGYIASY